MKSFLKNIIATTIGIISSIVILLLLFIGIITLISSDKKIELKEASILEINLNKNSVVERTSKNIFNLNNFSNEDNKTIELKDILDNIEKAKTDENIRAIYINSSNVQAGLSQIEEIRNKLLEFKKTKKKIIAYSEVYSQSAYYLASVANKIYLNPQGMIDLKGFSAQIMFYKKLFSKLDIDIQIIRHGKFKSAIEPFTLEKMSEANRKQMTLVLNSISNNILDSIAKQRNITLSEVKYHADNLNLTNTKKCLDLKYVDALIYQDQVEDSLSKLLSSKKLKIVSLEKYIKVESNEKEISRNKIAIIYANGTINSGKGDENSIGSETTVNAIKKAREDKNVKAIVLRINSGGGSALASDVILRETILTKKSGKPIVVSMGDYAASGGYYIACAADSIVANPTTITGSIGVFGMIPNLQNFYKNKLGITIDTINTNRYADMGMNRMLTEYERRNIKQNIKQVYDTFISHVSKGRNMSLSAVEEISQGRVWSGYDAKSIGLIDTYGGIDKSIKIAAALANVSEYRTISLPKKKDPLSELAIKLENGTNLFEIVSTKLGYQNKLLDPLKGFYKQDIIQARMPYIMKLK